MKRIMYTASVDLLGKLYLDLINARLSGEIKRIIWKFKVRIVNIWTRKIKLITKIWGINGPELKIWGLNQKFRRKQLKFIENKYRKKSLS